MVFLKFVIFFENFKFSTLQQVGNFSIIGSKISFSARLGGIKFEFWWGVLIFFDKAPKLYIKSLQCPFGVQARFTQRGRRPSLRMDGWMGGMGVSKVSFNFFHTLYVYRSCIYLLVFIIQKDANILMGLKI